jgi:hypothetical protein
MSKRKTDVEISGLVARSRSEVVRGNYAEAYRLIRDLSLTAGDPPGAFGDRQQHANRQSLLRIRKAMVNDGR